MRAILLAAGMGTRLRPLTLTTPKSLTVVNGEPLLERQIRFLKEVGVNDIVVVTGYLSEKFDYLVEKFNVELIHNDKYDIYNNLYTMYLVRHYLPDAYVIDADNYLCRNFLLENPETSLYFSAKKPYKNEWAIKFNEDYKVTDIIVSEQGKDFIMCGTSYWSKKDGEFLIQKIEETVKNHDFKDLYWDHIVKDNLSNLDVYVHKIHSSDTFEIDTVEELEQLRKLVEK